MLEVGQKTQARDFALALEGENGTFLVSKIGSQSLVVVCQEGHSIKSVRSTGPVAPIAISVGTDWEIEKLNDSTQTPEEIMSYSGGSREQRNRQPAGTRNT